MPVGDQPDDIYAKIKALILKYIQGEDKARHPRWGEGATPAAMQSALQAPVQQAGRTCVRSRESL